MESFSLDTSSPSSAYSKLRRRCNVARNASVMTKEIANSCGKCATTIVSKTQQTPYRLAFEAKIVTSLVFFATTVSIFRTSTLLKHIEANYDWRSLQVVQSAPSKLRVRFQNIYSGSPRVVFWDENADMILPRRVSSDFKLSNRIASDHVDIENNDENDVDIRMDPTRQYDKNDSADLPTLERPQFPNHEFDPHCLPAASWQTTFHPTCNEIHSRADIKQALVDGEFSLLSRKGFWRNAWLHHVEYVSLPSKTVWKTLKFSHRYEEKYYEDTRVDAIAMERLTASPYIINIYGFCGLTVVQEYGEKDLSRALAGGKMSSLSKLKLAKQVAEGLHHIHSIRDDDRVVERKVESKGLRKTQQQQQITLVHNDINLANLLFTADNRPMLNDFNIATLVMRHNTTGEMCPFYSHFPNPQWKAPEEQIVDDDIEEESNVGGGDSSLPQSHHLDTAYPVVNDKVDIYALGNIYYRLLTGLNPWRPPNADRLYDADKVLVARMKKLHGSTPPIPDETIRQAKTDLALQTILDVMSSCYRYQPAERPTALEIVQMFDNAMTKLN